MDFLTAWGIVAAELTPQPWTHTTPDGTLTVVPECLPTYVDGGEVVLRIDTPTASPEVSVRTPDVSGLVYALQHGEPWEWDRWGGVDSIDLVADPDAGVLLSLTERKENGPAAAVLLLPATERLPLASALQRALDVARGWESDRL